MGRVQENYIEAIRTGTVKFGMEGTSYSGGGSKTNLLRYLTDLDTRLTDHIQQDSKATIDWFGEPKSLGQHLMYMADHEVLHHGQWIIYRKQLGGIFPSSWSAWGL